MRTIFNGVVFVIFMAWAVVAGAAELKMPAIFSDEMVLQRDTKVAVWGWADAGAEVTVEFAGQKKTAKVDHTGKWMLKLDAMKACSEPQVMLVTSSIGNQKSEIKNILVGDVWLCSGQSNMAMTVDGKTGWLFVGGVANAKEEVRKSPNPMIRQFSVGWITGIAPTNDCKGKWTTADTNTTADFTATGYFFVRELQKRLNIPVAIISSSFGGSVVENWMSREMLLKGAGPDYVEEMNRYYDRYVNRDAYQARYVQDLLAWEKKYGVSDPAGAPGNSNKWADVSADIADWKKVTFPCTLAKAGYPGGGIIWFRKEVEIPAAMGSSWRLDVPGCKGNFAVYANGVMSSGGFRAGFPRKAIKAGKNTIAVRIHSYTGNGGIAGGDFHVVPFDPKLEKISLNGGWLCKAEAEFKTMPKDAEKPPVVFSVPPLHWTPIPAHFNTMLYPLIPYAIKGAAWYQGESNVGNAGRYRKHLQLLVKDWRERWEQPPSPGSGAPGGDFPFYICQLPDYGAVRTNAPGESGWAEIREAQAIAAREMPNAGIANLIDTCADGDLHPLNKQDVGYRLALVALANTYGYKDLEWSGPVYKSMKLDGSRVVIEFDHVTGGLVAKKLQETYPVSMRKPELGKKPLVPTSPGSEVQGFAVCEALPLASGGTSNQWVWADAKIDGSTVVVWSDKVAKPVAVRYAWANNPVCNLYNKTGLPAFPFRTDVSSAMSK
jgi:sialate O-acetylesterase